MFKRVRKEAEESGSFTKEGRRIFNINFPDDVEYFDAHNSKIVAETYVTTDDGGLNGGQGIYPVNLLPLQQMIDSFKLTQGRQLIDSRVNNAQYCANYEYFLQDESSLKSSKAIYGGSNDLDMDLTVYHTTCPEGCLYQHPLRNLVRPVAAGTAVTSAVIGTNELAVGGLRVGVENAIESSAPLRCFSTLFDAQTTMGACRQFPLKFAPNMSMQFELGTLSGNSQLMIPRKTPTVYGTNIASVNIGTGVFTTSAAHGLSVGQPVTISGVGGASAALVNRNWKINAIPATTTFSLVDYAGTVLDTTGMTLTFNGNSLISSLGLTKLTYACDDLAADGNVLYSTLTYEQRLYKTVPFYVGQKIWVKYLRNATTGATTNTWATRTITSLQIMAAGDANEYKLQITMNANITGTGGEFPTSITVYPAFFDSSAASGTDYLPVSVNWVIRKIELQLAAITLPPQVAKELDMVLKEQGYQFSFMRKMVEGVTLPGGTTFSHQMALRPFTASVVGMIVDPTTQRQAARNNLTSYRYIYDNIQTTTKDIAVGSPSSQVGLYVYKLADFYSNENKPLVCLAKRYCRVALVGTSTQSPEDIVILGEPVPCIPTPATLNIAAVFSAASTVTNFQFYHTIASMIIFEKGGVTVADGPYPVKQIPMPLDLVTLAKK